MSGVKTGIEGLDELLDGGFPKDHLTLLTGQTGAGKTIFGLQYLVYGAVTCGEKGIYISFEQSREDLILQSKTFGWEIEELEKNGLIKIFNAKPGNSHLIGIITDLEEVVKEFKPNRLVFDSISVYGVYAETISYLETVFSLGVKKEEINFALTPESITRKTIMDILEKLRGFNVTSIVISELPETTNFLSRDTISEFMADGVIILRHIRIGSSLSRSLEVRKMRYTKIKEGTHTYNLTSKGIVIEGKGNNLL